MGSFKKLILSTFINVGHYYRIWSEESDPLMLRTSLKIPRNFKLRYRVEIIFYFCYSFHLRTCNGEQIIERVAIPIRQRSSVTGGIVIFMGHNHDVIFGIPSIRHPLGYVYHVVTMVGSEIQFIYFIAYTYR